MRANENIKRACYAVATLSPLGEWWLGGVFASALGVPFLLLFQSVYWLGNLLFYWTIAFTAILFLIITQWALHAYPEKAPKAIVCDKILGVMISLAGVPLRWRIIFFGFVLFHLLNTLKPFAWYRRLIEYIEKLPGVFGVLGAEILSGVLVNFVLQLLVWVMS
ncbi:phosphatidylglycerophosphatase A [Candidatus Dependentiae bacterium]|nr:phosphatidylglycerophosphatase A [Candidatus Dependentiae bacterium]